MRDRDVKDEDKHTEPADAARELRAYEVRLPVVVLGLVALAGLIAFVLPPATWLATPLFCLAMFAAAFLTCVWLVRWVLSPTSYKLRGLNILFLWLICQVASGIVLPAFGLTHRLIMLGQFPVDPLAAVQIGLAIVFLLVWIVFGY